MQSVTMTTNSIILLLVLYTSCLCSTRDVYILPSEGEHCPGTPCYNISTFGRMARNNFSNTSGLAVHFLEGTHLLDLQELVVFTNLTNATFKGDNGRMEQGFHETVWQSTVVIKCTEHSSTGIGFANSSNITFRYITITNCGADMTTNLSNVSLGFLNVGNSIIIDHVSVQNGSGSGLTIISDGVNLSIATSSFAHNGYEEACNILIRYIDPHNCGNPQKHVYNTFITNTNVSQVQFRHSRWPSVGLAMKFLQESYSVTVILDSVILDSVMVYKNIGILIFSINVPNYNLTINNSRISDADDFALFVKTTSRIFENNNLYSNTNNNIINIFIINSQFIYNKGVCYFNFQGINHPVNITIRSTEFSHNMVTSYKLLHIDPLTRSASMLHFSSYAYQEQVRIVLQNVTINNNSVSWTKNDINNTSLLQPSAVHAEFVNLVLNNVKIINNNATGLLCYRTVVLVNSNSTSVFHNNTGIDGGGLAMYGDSYLLFENNSILHFTKNKAEQRGGAIFINTILPISPCFFQYAEGTHSQSTKAFFFGNNANTAGTVIFGGDEYCLLFTDPDTSNTVDKFHETFDYSAQTGPSVISSEPTRVRFCDNNNTINYSQRQLTMTAYPGQEINISVVTVGQGKGVTPGLIKIQPHGNTTVPGIIYTTKPMNCTTILFTPTADVHYSLALLHSTVGSVEVNIEKTECPLGFQTSTKTDSCECCKEIKQKSSSNNLNIKCYAANNKISRKGDAWIGNISDCVIVQTPCPFDYCKLTQTNISFVDPDQQCALNRTGVLCGGCRDDFSLVLGSNKCKNCTDSFHLALIIPFATAGFGLVALLMVLNLTVSIGTINGLIFYTSIVKISESTGIFFPRGPLPVLSQFIAWLNLDLGIETCFYPGMTAYAKVWLQFVFPLYIWFIIATIIVLCRYSKWLSNKIGGNVVQVFATLILISFTKILRTVVLAIKFETLGCVNGSANTNVVWYMDGNVLYLSPEHAVLMVAAVLFLLIGVPYTLALLFDAVIEKYLTRNRCFRRQWIKLKPFVDAYHGPYKDNCRFWTGLLLLVRMSFTLVSLQLDTYAALIFITTSTSVLLSLMIFFGGIYQNKYRNMLEWSSLFNLILLSAIYGALNGQTDAQQVVTIISVSVAFIIFLGVITFHVLVRAKMIEILERFIEKFHCKNEETRSLLDPNEDYVHQNLEQPTSSDVWLKRETLIFQS